jgi:hypothetical protein
VTAPAASRRRRPALLPALALALGGCAAARSAPAILMSPGAPPGGPARLASPEAPVYYVLHIEGRGLSAEATLNGVPVGAVEADARSTATVQLNAWVGPGANSLQVRGRLLPSPARPAAANGSGPALAVRLWRGASTMAEAEGNEVLVQIDWRPPAAAAFEQARVFTADPAPPSELWPHARPVALDAGNRGALAALAVSLEQALRRRDAGAAAALLSWKTTDLARARYQPADEAQTQQRDILENLLADRDFAIEPLDPAALGYDSYAGGRVVRLSRPAGPALQARLSQGGRFLLPIYAAHVDGRWTIVR